MPLQALLLSRDPETLRIMRRVLDELHMVCEAATGPDTANEILGKRRFDAVIVDCDDMHGSPQVLKGLRQTASNKRSLAFAIINGVTTVREAYDMGANFVLDKPLALERSLRSFRAAHGLMMRERRRYFRNPLSTSAYLKLADGRELRGLIVNLSEGGIAVQVSNAVILNSSLRLHFDLPGSSNRIEAKAEVSWLAEEGLAGLRFLHMEQKMHRDLEQWIAQQPPTEPAEHHSAPMFINAAIRSR